MSKKLLSLFPAFGERNYRYYFLGQLISQIGTWLQIVAQGWLVLQLTNSAFLIGLVAAAATLPSLLFSLFGGVIVDRFDKKMTIVATQTASMVLALLLGVLTVFRIVNVWEIMLISFLLGIVNAVDMPARQAFVSEMVPPGKVPSAIALNAGIFNSARVVGPSVAGILIAVVGTGGAFLLNGASYIAAIIVQFLIIPILVPKPKHPHPFTAIKQGVAYTWTHPVIRSLVILTAVVSVFGWSYTTIMPYVADKIFHQGAAGLGYLYAAAGAGALVATFVVSGFGSKFASSVFINGGILLYAVTMIFFSYTSNIWIAYLTLFLGGFGLLSAFSIINARIQHLVEPHFRGRVLSIYLLMFVGLFPVGNLQIGILTEQFGPQIAIRTGSVIVFVAAIVGYLLKGKIISSHAEYLTKREIEAGTQEVIVDTRKS